jgi:hypothetical protein
MRTWQASLSAQVAGPSGSGAKDGNRASARTCPAESGTSVGASPPAETGFRSSICRAGPGFGPGTAKRQTQGFGSWTVRQTEASAEDPAAAGPGLRLEGPRGGHRDSGSGSAERRTARASALTGSPRGNRKERKLRKDPGASAPEPPAQVRDSKPPGADCLAFQAWHPPQRDSGGWRRRQPPFPFEQAPFAAGPASLSVQPELPPRRNGAIPHGVGQAG